LGLKSSVNGTVYSTSPAYIGLLTNNWIPIFVCSSTRYKQVGIPDSTLSDHKLQHSLKCFWVPNSTIRLAGRRFTHSRKGWPCHWW